MISVYRVLLLSLICLCPYANFWIVGHIYIYIYISFISTYISRDYPRRTSFRPNPSDFLSMSATLVMYIQTKLCFLLYNSQFHTLLMTKTPAALGLDYPPYENDREVAASVGAVW